MASATLFFSKIALALNTKPEISHWSDNSSLVERLKNLCNRDPVAEHLKNDHDMYFITQNSMANLRITEAGHVKGHQDKLNRTLTTTEKLNIEADKLATKAVGMSRVREPEWCEEYPPMLVIRGKTITKKEALMLSIAAERDEFEKWQSEKLEMSRKQYLSIDWQAQHQAINKASKHSHCFIMKFVYHWLPSGVRKSWYNEGEDPKCPLCGEEEDKSSHFLYCKHRAMEKCFADTIDSLRNKIMTDGIRSAPAAKILANLKAWRRGGAENVRIGGDQGTDMNCAHFLHGRIPIRMRKVLPRDGGLDNIKALGITAMIAQTVIAGAEKAWRTRCTIAAGESPVEPTLGKKVRLLTRVNHILSEIRKTRIGYMADTDVDKLMRRPNRQIEEWVRMNEDLIRKFKKDPNQRTIEEFLGPTRNGTHDT
jgi:hypothetical protein